MAANEPHASWIELEAVVRALHRAGHADVAARLIDAERGGATASEILGDLGRLLNEHAALRVMLDDDARRAWDAVIRKVGRAFPGFRLRAWLTRLLPRPGHQRTTTPRHETESLEARFADRQTRAAYVAIRTGLGDGSLSLAQAKQLAIAIRPPVFDSGFSDGEKQVQDYEKRQIYTALDAVESRHPGASGQRAAELFDANVAELNLR